MGIYPPVSSAPWRAGKCAIKIFGDSPASQLEQVTTLPKQDFFGVLSRGKRLLLVYIPTKKN